MAITNRDQQEIAQLHSEFGPRYKGVKEDYFALLYLTRKFGLQVEEAVSQVAFGSNDYGIDAYHAAPPDADSRPRRADSSERRCSSVPAASDSCGPAALHARDFADPHVVEPECLNSSGRSRWLSPLPCFGRSGNQGGSGAPEPSSVYPAGVVGLALKSGRGGTSLGTTSQHGTQSPRIA
jgi:hypothetical protein